MNPHITSCMENYVCILTCVHKYMYNDIKVCMYTYIYITYVRMYTCARMYTYAYLIKMQYHDFVYISPTVGCLKLG